jgi:hypothetical protein
MEINWGKFIKLLFFRGEAIEQMEGVFFERRGEKGRPAAALQSKALVQQTMVPPLLTLIHSSRPIQTIFSPFPNSHFLLGSTNES